MDNKPLIINHLPSFTTPLKTEKERTGLKQLYNKTKMIALKYNFKIRERNDHYSS